jgi:hypothetical protein
MKQQLWIGATLCLVTLILTYGFNQLTQHVAVTNGRVVIGSPISISGTVLSEMEIDNWTSKQIDGLILVVPSSVSLSSIVSSFPINIEEVKGVSGSQTLKRISFSGIPPHRTARVMIPLTTAQDMDNLHLPNLEPLNLEVLWGDYSEDPSRTDIKRTTINMIVYTFYVVLLWFFGQRFLNASLKKSRQEIDVLLKEDEKRRQEYEEKRMACPIFCTSEIVSVARKVS